MVFSRADAIRRTVPRLASDTLWYSVAGVVGKALALLSVPFLTRALGPSDYGLVDLSTATAGLLAVVAMFAGDIPLSRLIAHAGSVDDRRRAYTEYIVAASFLASVMAIVVMLSASFIASAVWSSPGSEALVILSAALIPISGVRSALATLHRLEGNSRRFALLTTLDVGGQVAFAVAFVALGFGAYGAVLGLIAGGSLALVVTIATTHRLLATRFDARAAADLIAKGVPFLPPLVAFVGADYLARTFIAGSLGQAAVGEFGLALRIASVLALMTAAFQLAWSPRAAAMIQGAETTHIFGRTLLGYAISAGLVCIVLVSAAPEVVGLVSGSEFAGASVVLPALAFAAVLAGTHFILSMGSVVNGGSWMVATSALSGAIVQVLVTAITIGALGLWAAGLGAVVGRAVSVGLLAPRVAPAFGRRMVSASVVLVAVAVVCLLIGLTATDPTGSRPLRVLVAVGAGVALAGFACTSLGWAEKNPS